MIISDLRGKTIGAAVSGGLDSCIITRWMTDHGVHVVCFSIEGKQHLIETGKQIYAENR